jgi:hypothetical protein
MIERIDALVVAASFKSRSHRSISSGFTSRMGVYPKCASM